MNSRTPILRLLPCDPMGSLRESHASLLIRTAWENDRSPALFLESLYSPGAGRRTARSQGSTIGQTLNGCGKTTGAMVERTEALTMFSNIRASTTLSFAAFSTTNGLLRNCLAWSSGHLSQSKPTYYPLVYALEAVRVCPLSKETLVSLCPNCRNPVPCMSGSSRIGECPKCRASLATALRGTSAADPVAGSIRDLDYEIWIAQQLGDYVAYQVSNSLDAKFAYTETLRFWFGKFEVQNSQAGARLLGVSQPAISIWLSTGAIPKLRVTLGLCWVFGLSLLEFLQRRLPEKHDGKLRPPAEARVRQNSVFRRRRIDRPAMGAKLTEILRDNLYALLPFEEICEKKLDRGGFVVRQYFPDLAQSISKRYLANRRLLAEIRREQFCTAIKTVSRFLHSRGITPNHKTLQQYLDKPTRLRCDWAIAALREVRAELGYDDDGEQLLLAV